MADKDDEDSSHSFSASSSDSEGISDCGRNDNTIPSIPTVEHQENGDDNSAVIERFLEQVASSANTNNRMSSTGTPKEETSKGKDKEKELKKAKRMIIPPECRCHLNNGQPCHTRFSVGELMDTRMHYMSISKKELDIAVLAKLECGIHLTKMTTRKKRKPTERKKHRTDFYHRGYRICNLMFVYLHGFSYKKLKALIIQYKTNGVRTRIHKNLKPKPPEEELKPKKKKVKPKPKPKPKDQPKTKKQRLMKGRKDKKEGESNQGSESTVSLQCQNTSPSKVHQQLLPPAPHPPPPPPPPHHHYPVAFPMSTQNNHPHAATAFVPAPHTQQQGFPHPVSYNTAPVFPAHPMAGHNPHPHPVVSNHSNINPPLDYSSQRGLPNPPLDFSNQRNNANGMQGFQSGTGRPCVTYSVVHSVTF